MLSRSGTAIVILTAIATVAATVGVVAPTAHAARNDGRFALSAEAQRQNKDTVCEGIWDQFESKVNEATTADKAGNTAARDAALGEATSALRDGRTLGCGWAARAVVPTPTSSVPVVSVSPLKLSVR